jgi:uncharacterized protein (TIGR03382 family)
MPTQRVLAAAFTLLTATQLERVADASTCTRWVNQLHPCDGLVAMSVCNDDSQWSDGQWRNYFNWIYADTAQDACYKEVLKLDPGMEDTATVVAGDICVYDYDDDGDIDGRDYSATASTMSTTEFTREPECDLTPEGPWKDLSTGPGTPGEHFLESVRNQVLDANYSKYGSLKSDAGPSADPQPGTQDFDQVRHTRVAHHPYTDDPDVTTVPQVPTNLTDYAQIDHIIPRRDVNGCPCGPDDASNALVISSQLNQSMSNRMDHPDRIKLLKEFVPGYVPPAPRLGPPDEPTIDEDPEHGGCSAGGAGGPLTLALLALGLAARRRRA